MKSFLRSENTPTITIKNADEVKDLDTEIGDFELKESVSTEATTTEEFPILNEAISVVEETMSSVIGESSDTLDRQSTLEHSLAPLSMMDEPSSSGQSSGILHRQFSIQQSPRQPPKRLPSSPV